MSFMGTIVNQALSSLHRGLLDLMSRVLTVSIIYFLFIEMTYSLLNDQGQLAEGMVSLVGAEE